MSFIADSMGFRMTNWGTISVDPDTFATNISGVFACGDFLTGTRDVINVIADGHKTAMAIDKFIQDVDMKKGDEEDEIEEIIAGYPYKERGYDTINRHTAVTIDIKERVSSFNEVEKGFMEEAAILEAKRCLQCNHIWTQDKDRCFLCRNCEEVCPLNCLTVSRLDELEHNRFFNEGIPHTVQGITPVRINLELCIRCGLCEQVCPVDAISFKVKKPCETTAKIKITEDVAEF
ncbi:MAG: 4Fe-4S binding protein [Nitrospinae bacterium]|nr:4Fe-4S binding protein [Nitrospinota bacterium]